ncbi:MAG: hypothetical protein KAU28_05520 [Phycisphaerae bacterium]|nr:hypothetical protein [Phycisphaerae bacterium]
MWEQLDKPLAIFLVVALPLAWGLGAEYVFELLRRRKNSPQQRENDSP